MVCYHETVANTGDTRWRRFMLALLIGGLLGAVVGLSIKNSLTGTSGAGVPGLSDLPDGDTVPPHVRDSVAWHYASAYKEGDWPRVIALTMWMEERLDYVARSGTSEDVDRERGVLIDQASSRLIEENTLRDVGVDDQYIFTPGAQLEYTTEDSGQEGLEAPVAGRTWFRVTYPNREKALLDKEGIPIRSVLVGVNVSVDGRVLKAGVVGNLDIDWDSIQYDWPPR